MNLERVFINTFNISEKRTQSNNTYQTVEIEVKVDSNSEWTADKTLNDFDNFGCSTQLVPPAKESD